MKIITKIVLSCAMAVLFSGCASVAGDNSRAVKISSAPAGAKIYVDNQQYGVAPATITLPSYIYGGKAITLKKAGYEEQTQVVNTKFQKIGLFNLLFWPGFVVDAATGDIVKIDPASTNLQYHMQRA